MLREHISYTTAPKTINTNNDYPDTALDSDNGYLKSSVAWSNSNENMLVEWCDIAMCYKWMHTDCHMYYSALHIRFTIPIIVLSTITGTASFAQINLVEPAKNYASMVIGSVNIIVGMLSTIQQYLKISEINEMHRIASISWDKLSRNIRIELAKTPTERGDAKHFIKMCRLEYDRLMETSPAIRNNTITKFFSSFSGKVDSIQRRRFEMLRKPDICNSIVSINETRKRWFDNDIIVQQSIYPVPFPNFKSFGKQHTLRNKIIKSVSQLKSPQSEQLNDGGCLNTARSNYSRTELNSSVHRFVNKYAEPPLRDSSDLSDTTPVKSDKSAYDRLLRVYSTHSIDGAKINKTRPLPVSNINIPLVPDVENQFPAKSIYYTEEDNTYNSKGDYDVWNKPMDNIFIENNSGYIPAEEPNSVTSKLSKASSFVGLISPVSMETSKTYTDISSNTL